MSRLEELIQELCPDGVEYRPLGGLMSRVKERGKDDRSVKQVYAVSNSLGIVKAEDLRENTIHSEDTSNYTVLRNGMVAYNPSRLNIGSIAMLENNEPGLVSPMYIVFRIDESKVLRKYFVYLLRSSYVRAKIDSFKEEGARFRFDYDRWDWIMIQLPPLEIQREIVHILDQFTTLQAELSAELSARRKQYEYYRDLLLSNNGVQEKTLEEIAHIFDSLHQTPQYTEDGFSIIRVQDVKGGVIDTTSTLKVSEEDYLKYTSKYKPQENDIVISRVGSFGRFGLVPKEECCLGQNVSVIHPLINARYLYYFINTKRVKKWIEERAKGSGHKAFGLSDIKKIPILVPSEKEQERISRILDSFEYLSSDLQIGLPAEIEARTKQYEYYQDKLLSFKKKEAL